jgi:N-methylhydantoinase B
MSAQERIVDNITFEVVRNKLTSIIKDQTTAIRSISGSPVVTEATDFNNGIFFKDGIPLQIGFECVGHAHSVAEMIVSTTRECAENPGIMEDDQFFLNDPWKGAIHQNDAGVVAPIFYKGELVAWSGALTHQIDMGGMEFGSWCPRATDVFQESVPIPPIKLVEKGEVRKDIWNMLLAHSRLPFLVGLDLKAMVGANNVAKREFIELADRYGIDVVHAVMVDMLNATEQRLRARLREIPDGIYRAVGFVDHDGHANRLYKVSVAITKEGDHMVVDFSDSSPQAPGFINISRNSVIGTVGGKIWDTLCFNMPWTGGIFKTFEVVAPDGLIVTAQFPAPIGGGVCNSFFASEFAMATVLAKMLACTDKYKREVSAAFNDSWDTINLGGLNQYGEPFGTMMNDVAAGGEGAWSHRDGVSGQGIVAAPEMFIADVETNENFAPILYLHRRLTQDGGGAGRWRGGDAAGLSFTLHDANFLGAVVVCRGPQVPCRGMFGGLPGGCTVNTLVKNSDILERLKQSELVSNIGELKGEKTDLGAKPGAFPLSPGDVFESTWQSAGGYGDPLEREPERVLQDVVGGIVSSEWARKLYGVVIDQLTMQIDVNGTKKQRQEILQQRLAAAREVPKVSQIDVAKATRLMPIGEYLEVIEADNQKVVRCRCNYQFGPITQNWKHYAAKVIAPDESTGRLVKCHDELEIREYICPNCGVLLDVDVARKDDPLFWDIELKI